VKRTLVSTLFLAVLCCLLSVSPCDAGTGEVKFGTGVTKDWQMINEAREFDTNLIACGFYADEPFGVMQVVFSVYFQPDSPPSGEVLLARITMDVNPQWAIMILPDLPLPGIGKYTMTLSEPEGEVLAVGDVKITEKKVEKKMPEQPKVDGTTLEGLFNKFKPNN
jgi:hypothetical protein